MVKLSKPELAVFLIPLAVYVLTLHASAFGPLFNVVGAQFSMWKYHTFSVGTGSLQTNSTLDPDTFLYKGNYYDVYPPGLMLFSFPFALAGFQLDGGVLSNFGFAVLFDEFFVALCAALATLMVYRICRWYATASESMLAAFTLAFATSVWPFATVTYSHDATMAFALASVYFMMLYFRGGRSILTLALSGIFLGSAALSDYLSVLFVIPLLAYVIYGCKTRMRGSISDYLISIGAFLVAFVAVASVNLLYNYSIFGDYKTFPSQFYVFAQLPPQSGLYGVLARFDLEGLPVHALMNLISPYRGLLLLSPVLLFGFYGLYKMTRAKALKTDAILFFSLFLTNFIPYSAWGAWDGGNSYGPRFLIYGLPYLVIPVAVVLYQNKKSSLKAVFVSLFAFSCIIQGAGAFTFANQLQAGVLVYQPISVIFPQILSFNLGVWWFQPGLITNPLLTVSIVVAIFATILGITLTIASGGRRSPFQSKTGYGPKRYLHKMR